MRTRTWIVFLGAIAFLGCAWDDRPTPAPSSGPSGPVQAAPGPSRPAQPSEWVTHKPDDAGFSVLLPVKSEVSSQPGKVFTTHLATCSHNGVDYTVLYFDPPAAAIAPNVVDATLKRDRDSGVRDIQGTLVSEEKISVKKNGTEWPGLASVMENATHHYNGHQYAVDGRVYALQASYARKGDHSADVKKFLDSFKITEGAGSK